MAVRAGAGFAVVSIAELIVGMCCIMCWLIVCVRYEHRYVVSYMVTVAYNRSICFSL